MMSMTGIIKKNPGPFRAWKRPSLKITALSHWSATLIAEEMMLAKAKVMTAIPVPATSETVEATKAKIPPRPRIIKKIKVANGLGLLMGIAFRYGFMDGEL